MEKIIHCTSHKNWINIQKRGLLLPLTTPEVNFHWCSAVLRQMIKHESYLVGMPLNYESWKESGIFDYLLRHVKGEVVLEVPILDFRDCFIREMDHVSPKRTLEIYGVNLFKELYAEEIDLDDPRLKETQKRYTDSTISLFNYRDNYLVPEIWLPQKTPIERIALVI